MKTELVGRISPTRWPGNSLILMKDGTIILTASGSGYGTVLVSDDNATPPGYIYYSESLGCIDVDDIDRVITEPVSINFNVE